LGEAVSHALGGAVPSIELRGVQYYFAGDLYLWLEDNAATFEIPPLLEDWKDQGVCSANCTADVSGTPNEDRAAQGPERRLTSRWT